MQLPDLAAFLAVATDRSFSAAARRLNRTQPAISQAVRRIEDELGERLFDRSSRDGTLTEAGRLLHDYAQRLLTLAGEAQTAVLAVVGLEDRPGRRRIEEQLLAEHRRQIGRAHV